MQDQCNACDVHSGFPRKDDDQWLELDFTGE